MGTSEELELVLRCALRWQASCQATLVSWGWSHTTPHRTAAVMKRDCDLLTSALSPFNLAVGGPLRPDDLSSVSITSVKVTGENQLHRVVPWPQHVCHDLHSTACMCTHNIIQEI